MKRIAVLILGAVLLGLTAAACGESSATAKKNFCNSLSNLSSTVMNYQGLDPKTATNEEISNAGDDIASAWDDVVNEADDWANADDNSLTQAYNDLYNGIQSLPDDNTIAEDIDALQPQLSAFPEAYRETFDGSGCSSA
jgi:hypothetical protein